MHPEDPKPTAVDELDVSGVSDVSAVVDMESLLSFTAQEPPFDTQQGIVEQQPTTPQPHTQSAGMPHSLGLDNSFATSTVSRRSLAKLQAFLQQLYDRTWGGYNAPTFARQKPSRPVRVSRDLFPALLATGKDASIKRMFWTDSKAGAGRQEQRAMAQLADFADITSLKWQQAVQISGYMLGATDPTSAVLARDVAVASRNRENAGYFGDSVGGKLQGDRVRCAFADCALALAQQTQEFSEVASRELVDRDCGLVAMDGHVHFNRDGVSTWEDIAEGLRQHKNLAIDRGDDK
ncbi:hypothetical protein BCR44DRAFT_404689 [Catenaria anguillulae PL171]|uniref:Uncharacterized protein n=1 Tax=Catenaria anguillulae PL171 TaxID=765915 RepID=A0A1Y2H6M3_9FUNG|nr:hypothetical protein BCR44DRAFT_404689 [Catenaria anguillulae PL171]